MSFKQNDNNESINLGNYEEFFVLYMDNELDAAGVQMVDAFLEQHPDLRAELELLMGTKLPSEHISFDSSALLSGAMKENVVDEDLFLLVDGELPADRVAAVEKRISSDKDTQMQHQQLLMTKLDASEKLVYPYKDELYRQEERRRMMFQPWMRIAAAVLVIATAAVLYFANRDQATNMPAIVNNNNNNINNSNSTNKGITPQIAPGAEDAPGQQPERAPVTEMAKNSNKENTPDPANTNKENLQQQQNLVADNGRKDVIKNNEPVNDMAVIEAPRATKTAIIPSNTFSDAIAINAVASNSEIINTQPVTSFLDNRTTGNSIAETDQDRDVSKGSFKGFLRKATRMIEKKTGIDPTNDGELLIGAVAINLN